MQQHRCKKCNANLPHEFKHGTSGYNYHGCRCDTCREAVAVIKRRFRERHPDRVREDNRRRYWQQPEVRRAGVRAWYQENKERVREYNEEYRRNNLDRLRERDREDYHLNRKGRQREYREANAEKISEYGRDYYERNRKHLLDLERERRGHLKDYLKRRAAVNYQRLVEEIPAPRGGEPWSATEDSIALRDDVSLIEICYMLGRSYGAVRSRRVRLRDTSYHRDDDCEDRW